MCQDYQNSLESGTNILRGNAEAWIAILKDIPKREAQVEAVSLEFTYERNWICDSFDDLMFNRLRPV
jgi:hypothetical protein